MTHKTLSEEDFMNLFDGSPSVFSDLAKSEHANVFNVSAKIDELLASRDAEDEYGGLMMPGLHASFLSSTDCTNAIYYSLLEGTGEKIGTHEVFGAETLRKFDAGTDIHTRFQHYMTPYLYGTWVCHSCGRIHNAHTDYLKYVDFIANGTDQHKNYAEAVCISNRIVSHSKKPVKMPGQCACGSHKFRYAEWRVINKKYRITSKMDGVFKNGNGEFIGWEIKSASNAEWQKFYRQANQNFEKYKRQFGLYLMFSKFRYGIFTFVNKDNQKSFDIPVDLQDIDLTGIMTRIEDALKFQKHPGVLPVSSLGLSCNRCKFYHSPCTPKMNSNGANNDYE